MFGRHFGDTPAELEAAYGPYAARTHFGAVFLPNGTAVGAVRLLRHGPMGLKSLQDAAARPWLLSVRAMCRAADIDPERTWDVGSFGIDSTMVRSSNRVTLSLFSVMFGAFRDNDVASFVAILDAAARRPIGALGVEMLDLPGATPAAYLGSAASTPVYRHVDDLHRMHRSRFAHIHRRVFHGGGVAGRDPTLYQRGAFTLGMP